MSEMHPEDIKAAIRKRFRTVRRFEAAYEIAADSVRDHLRGKSRRGVIAAVKAATGIDLHGHNFAESLHNAADHTTGAEAGHAKSLVNEDCVQ